MVSGVKSEWFCWFLSLEIGYELISELWRLKKIYNLRVRVKYRYFKVLEMKGFYLFIDIY